MYSVPPRQPDMCTALQIAHTTDGQFCFLSCCHRDHAARLHLWAVQQTHFTHPVNCCLPVHCCFQHSRQQLLLKNLPWAI